MTVHRSLYAAAAVAVILAAGAVVTTQAQNAAARGITAAVVDVEGLFQGLAEREQIEAMIKTKIEKLQQKEQSKRSEIKDIQTQMGILDPDSAEYEKLRQDLEHLVIELQVELQYEQRQIELEKAIQIENLYRKILANVESVAKERNYDIVLFKDQTPAIRGANQQQLAALIQVRKLLYANPSLEVTETIKQRMNAKFNAGNG